VGRMASRGNMNIHHLELFYYVARYGGISNAVRNIPYGIQQPAVSGQVAQLEEYLGVTLFRRRPFALTQAGEKLYGFILPFFSKLDSVAEELQGGKARQVRLGASPVVLREHLPEFLKAIQRKNPMLRFALKEGTPAGLEDMLDREEIDLAISVMENKPGTGMRWEALIELPLALLVPASSGIREPGELWTQDKIQEPLICLPATEPVCKRFQQGLSRLGTDWFPTIEVSSLDLIETYVANGFGIGISVRLPRAQPAEGVRVLELDGGDFAPIVIGALWRGNAEGLLEVFLDEMRLAAKKLSSASGQSRLPKAAKGR
jgi:DNA-binding transcriptional LysR family regulator